MGKSGSDVDDFRAESDFEGNIIDIRGVWGISTLFILQVPRILILFIRLTCDYYLNTFTIYP